MEMWKPDGLGRSDEIYRGSRRGWKATEELSVYGGLAISSAALGLGVAEYAGYIDTTPQASNIIKIISKPGRWGYRIDKSDIHKPYIHQHFWRW